MGFIFVLIGQGPEAHSALCIKQVVDRKAQYIPMSTTSQQKASELREYEHVQS